MSRLKRILKFRKKCTIDANVRLEKPGKLNPSTLISMEKAVSLYSPRAGQGTDMTASKEAPTWRTKRPPPAFIGCTQETNAQASPLLTSPTNQLSRRSVVSCSKQSALNFLGLLELRKGNNFSTTNIRMQSMSKCLRMRTWGDRPQPLAIGEEAREDRARNHPGCSMMKPGAPYSPLPSSPMTVSRCYINAL